MTNLIVYICLYVYNLQCIDILLLHIIHKICTIIVYLCKSIIFYQNEIFYLIRNVPWLEFVKIKWSEIYKVEILKFTFKHFVAYPTKGTCYLWDMQVLDKSQNDL